MKQAEYQISLFDGDHKLTIDKPIRLIELFAGYGSHGRLSRYRRIRTCTSATITPIIPQQRHKMK